jgi:hypothetical protein
MDERRADARLLCADVVEVRWTNVGGKICQATALLEDIATHGACLQLDKAVPPQTAITIEHAKGEMHGIVRYCVFREIGYFVGIQFEPDSAWSRHEFTPQHLLDLEDLLMQRFNQRSPPVRPADKNQ